MRASPAVERSNSPIVAAYRERTPRSAALAARARGLLPSGIVHDARRLDPYEVYVTRAEGARKHDVDGNAYIDYYGGHGALILGHAHPEVTAAVQAQMARGTHYAACHELEVEWAALVQRLVPCAERIRFTSSGTEANLMALRLARAFTGRDRVVRFRGHFHGWQDHAAFGVDNHLDGTPTPGVLAGIAENVLLASPEDLPATIALLESRDDIAAVLLEPTGGSFGVLPMAPGFVEALRRVTAERGIVLIFDEVVTGFRVSRHGFQGLAGITPDLATFAKILAGGLPGGAVTGRRDILDWLDHDAAAAGGFEKIAHHGTFNANPVSAAAGVTALGIIEREDACERASANGAKLRALLAEVLAEEEVAWAPYGEHSAFYLYTNPEGAPLDPRAFDAYRLSHAALKASAKNPVVRKLRLALLVNGVDVSNKPGGTTSSVHAQTDLEQTAEAFRAALRMLRAEGEI